MANTFKNALSASVGTSAVDVYTAGSGVTATVIGLTVANRTASAINVDVQVTDTSGAVTTYLVKGAPVPTGGALIVVGGDQKVVLEASDKITVTSDTASSADVTVSLLEQA
jgi:hypothetical protein